MDGGGVLVGARVCVINPGIRKSERRLDTIKRTSTVPGRGPATVVVEDPRNAGHGLLRAAHTAFAQHVPLFVGPEAILITIMQSLALLVRHAGADQFAGRFNCSVGAKMPLEVREDRLALVDSGEGSTELWEGVFERFHDLIDTQMSPVVARAAACDFSTSTATHRAVANLVLMDVAQPFATYRVMSFCGIPEIHLNGTHGDWTRLCAKIASLRGAFPELEWWWGRLTALLDRFAELSDRATPVDCAYWQSFYKYQEASGGDTVTGRINLLYPLVTTDGGAQAKNPYFKREQARKWGTAYSSFPRIVSSVPIKWSIPGGGSMSLVARAGLRNLSQDADTLSVRAEPFWTVERF